MLSKFPIFFSWSFRDISSSISKNIPMKFLVFTIVREKHKILNSIVIANLINMVNNFFRRKVSSNTFFHYKPVLKNVHLIVMRMIGCVFMDISMPLFKNYNLKVIPTFFRATFTPSLLQPMWLNKKFFATLQARLLNTCRVCFTHASPRTSYLMFLKSSKIFIANWTNFMVFPRHTILSVVSYLPMLSNISYYQTRSR